MLNHIEVYTKKYGVPLNRGEKAAISRRVRQAGFSTEWDGNTIIVGGPYYGEAVEAINELGYTTDEDENLEF